MSDLAPSSPDSDTLEVRPVPPARVATGVVASKSPMPPVKLKMKVPPLQRVVVQPKANSLDSASSSTSVPSSSSDSESSDGASEDLPTALAFEFSDRTPIPLPKSSSAFLGSVQIFSALRELAPGKYRFVDSFFAASELFLSVLNELYREQRPRLEGAKKKFTWKNDGPLAENFAIACDWAKMLHDALRRHFPALPTLHNWMGLCVDFWMNTSKIAEDHVPRTRYMTKVNDWQTGGTRYAKREDSQIRSNVQFADVLQRTQKLEQYMLAKKNAAPASVKRLATQVSSVLVGLSDGAIRQVTAHTMLPRVQLQSRQLQTPVMKTNQADLIQHEIAHKIHKAVGAGCVLLSTIHTESMLKDLLIQCKQVKLRSTQFFVLKAVTRATRAMQQCFEAAGGVTMLKDWVVQSLEESNELHFESLLDAIISLRCTMSSATLKVWETPPVGSKRHHDESELTTDGLDWIKRWHWKEQTKESDPNSANRCARRNGLIDRLGTTLRQTELEIRRSFAAASVKKQQSSKEDRLREALLRQRLLSQSGSLDVLRGMGSQSFAVEVPSLPNGGKPLPLLFAKPTSATNFSYDVCDLLGIE